MRARALFLDLQARHFMAMFGLLVLAFAVGGASGAREWESSELYEVHTLNSSVRLKLVCCGCVALKAWYALVPWRQCGKWPEEDCCDRNGCWAQHNAETIQTTASFSDSWMQHEYNFRSTTDSAALIMLICFHLSCLEKKRISQAMLSRKTHCELSPFRCLRWWRTPPTKSRQRPSEFAKQIWETLEPALRCQSPAGRGRIQNLHQVRELLYLGSTHRIPVGEWTVLRRDILIYYSDTNVCTCTIMYIYSHLYARLMQHMQGYRMYMHMWTFVCKHMCAYSVPRSTRSDGSRHRHQRGEDRCHHWKYG